MKTISILNSALTLLACAVAFCCPATTLPDSLISIKANSNKIIYIDGRPTSATEIQHDIDS
ncbi:MAG: hypothetical protein K2F79_09645, partial [Muribaculaceae bacterium]|nr:hypothetical protein [Muribaculaceae bacterium]